MLNSLKTNGYNTVRWFVDPGEFTNPSHGISTGANSVAPINRAYMSNVIDFVKQAAADGIYSIPVIDNVPPNTFYQDIIGPLPADIAPANAPYLDPKYVVAKETYLRRFVGSLLRGIGKQNAGDILPIDTDNQVEFDAS